MPTHYKFFPLRGITRRIIIWLTVVLFGGFFVFTAVFSAPADIIINEIGAYPTSTHEWVEIWNKGNEPVDLTGWKFWENNTNHGLNATGSDSIVLPGEYAAICQNAATFIADHPAFGGSVFDSSWTSLSENGEEIGLKDSSGNFIEKFTYLPTTKFSLERRDPNLIDYTSANWQEHASGNTLGFINSNFSIAAAVTATPTTTSPSSPATSLPNTSETWLKIKINELLPNPASGNEWVELYNNSSENLDLTGGILCDARNTTSTCKVLGNTIAAGGWLVVDLLTDSYLNNSGDIVSLKNPGGATINQINYSGNLIPAKGLVLARKIDGRDSGSDSDWAITIKPTPGLANTIVSPSVVERSSGGGSSTGSSPSSSGSAITPQIAGEKIVASETRLATSTSPLILNELYPNPPGPDLEDEFIEIKNISSATVDLAGWSLADAAKKFKLTGSINPGEVAAWERTKTGLSLNNTAEEIRLHNPAGDIADIASYLKALEGLSYSRDSNGWHWSEEVTKNQPNIIDTPDTINLFWKITAPASGEPGELLTFDAAGTADPRGGELHFLWNFSDTSSTFPGEKISRAFATSGLYAITIFATSSAGTADEKQLAVAIGWNGATNDAVVINEVFPNPAGVDSNEFIELYNDSSSTVNVSGWQIGIKNGKTFTVPEKTIMPPHEFLTFFSLATRLHLNNAGDKVELSSADRRPVDLVKLSQSSPGQSFALMNGEFNWVNTPTPGRANTQAPQQVAGKKITAIISPRVASRGRFALADARTIEKGAYLTVRGLVTALPNTFSAQYFYLSDDNGGLQIYQNKKDFPELALGDYVQAVGIISAANGTKRLRIKDKTAIDILAIAAPNTGEPNQITLDNLSEEVLGTLIKVTGEITEIKSNFVYLDDGSGELKIYFKQGAHIGRQQFALGQRVEITGILEQSQAGWQLWPRGNDDIKELGLSETAAQERALLEANNARAERKKYLAATAGGITALFLGFLARARGLLVKDGLKKIVSLAAGFIKKNKIR